jgi:hypothetical protein
MKKLSKALITSIVAATLLFSSTTVFAASPFTVNGGGLLLNTNSDASTLSGLTSDTIGNSVDGNSILDFGSANIFMANTIPPVDKTDNIRIDDNTGTAQGWNVTVSATDLTATVVDKTTATAGATLSVNIPSDEVLQVNPADATAINNSDLTNVSAQNTAGIPVSASAVPVLSAEPTYGAGAYLQALPYTLTIPNYLPSDATVTPTDTANSQFKNPRADGSNLPLLAGTYSTTLTYNVVAAQPQD